MVSLEKAEKWPQAEIENTVRQDLSFRTSGRRSLLSACIHAKLIALKPHKYFTSYELRGCNVPLPPFLFFFSAWDFALSTLTISPSL